MIPATLKNRLRQRAAAILEADTDTEGFADDVADTIGVDRGDVPLDVMNHAEMYYQTIAKRLIEKGSK